MDQRIYEIARFYGQEHQARKCKEECLEVIDAINDILALRADSHHSMNNSDEKYEHLAEEISDVRIMLDQIEHLFGLLDRCEYWRAYKLDRQMTRIRQEVKNGNI